MRIILSGGGTAGHVMPAVAIAEEITQREKDAKILFIGREAGGENDAITRAGFPIKLLNVKGLQRKISVKNIKNAFLALAALAKAAKIIQEFRPDIIVGTGGYVCWPVIKAAQLMKIPTVIHESNACPGLVTRLVEKKCDKVLLNMPVCAEKLKFPEKAITIGNPIRKDFEKIGYKEARRTLGISNSDFFIVSFGGSGGAEKLNDCVTELMLNYSIKREATRHLHGTGKKYYDKYAKICPTVGKCRVTPYIQNVHLYLAAADLAICRCGAMTLSELAILGTPAILIPSPNVTDNHQYKNGKSVSDRGGAVMIDESELSASKLEAIIEELRGSARLSSMREKIGKLGNADAAARAADIIYGLRRVKKT